MRLRRSPACTPVSAARPPGRNFTPCTQPRPRMVTSKRRVGTPGHHDRVVADLGPAGPALDAEVAGRVRQRGAEVGRAVGQVPAAATSGSPPTPPPRGRTPRGRAGRGRRAGRAAAPRHGWPWVRAPSLTRLSNPPRRQPRRMDRQTPRRRRPDEHRSPGHGHARLRRPRGGRRLLVGPARLGGRAQREGLRDAHRPRPRAGLRPGRGVRRAGLAERERQQAVPLRPRRRGPRRGPGARRRARRGGGRPAARARPGGCCSTRPATRSA